jgi:DNA-binding NtrC family response regulator
VVLDVVMPRLRGPEALARMRAIRPELKALFVSGYPGVPSAASAGEAAVTLRKPFTSVQLAEEMRRAVALASAQH